jgi:hypothetical protein
MKERRIRHPDSDPQIAGGSHGVLGGGRVYSVDFKFNDNCLKQSWDDFHLINIKKCIVILKSTELPHPPG